jgi:hypothetical protein
VETRPALFVDSSGWIGLLFQRDENHQRARAVWVAMGKARAPLVTSSLVIAEVHAFLLSRIGHLPAQRFLRSALDGDAAELVWVDADLASDAAEGWVYRRPDRTFSLTDAVSFEIMTRRGMNKVFSFDRDFERAGFRLLK